MSTTFMEFPAERQQKIQAAQQKKMASVANGPMPAAIPVADGPMQQRGPQHAARPPVQVRPPIGQPRVEGLEWAQQPMPQPVAAPVQATAQQAARAPIAPQQGTIANPMPGFTNAIAEPEAMSLALPSRFAYYGFKDVYIRPFLARHIAKLQKAHREQSLLPIVEAVSSVMYTTDPNYANRPIAFDLTLPDFYMALYWLRMNSFTKSNYIHTTRCNNPAHLEAVENGEKPEDTLNISQVITKSELKVVELEKVPDPEIYHFSDSSAMVFRPPTMRDVIEFAESPELQDNEQREEFTFLAQLATHIQHREFELTLAQRIEIVKNATADQVELIQDFEQALGEYGVIDTVKVQCKECGHQRETRLNIAAHSFFR